MVRETEGLQDPDADPNLWFWASDGAPLPFEAASFALVFLTGVFTHLLPRKEVFGSHLQEIA